MLLSEIAYHTEAAATLRKHPFSAHWYPVLHGHYEREYEEMEENSRLEKYCHISNSSSDTLTNRVNETRKKKAQMK